jgi:four helix bundle protein
MALTNYRDLEVWQAAIDLVETIYKLTKEFPRDERFGFTSQIQRAAVSIPSNIAEGYGRSHRGDYLRHLSVAKGSLAELETQLVVAVRLSFISREQAESAWKLSQRIGGMLFKLISSLKKSPPCNLET